MTKQSKVLVDVDGEIGPSDVIRFSRRNWKLIASFGFSGLALSALLVIVTPAQYEATMLVRMARISPAEHSTSTEDKGNIETPAALIEQLNIPATYTDDVLHTCGAKTGDDVGSYMNNRIKASVMKGATDVIVIKLRASTPENAKSCANSLLNMISSDQQSMIADVLKEKQVELKGITTELENEGSIFDRLNRKSMSTFATFVHLSKLDSIKGRMARLNDAISYAQTHPTKLVSPIYVPEHPVFPKVPIFLLLGTLAGLLLSLIYATLRDQYRLSSAQE